MTARQRCAAAQKSLARALKFAGVLPPEGYWRYNRLRATRGSRIDAWLVGQYEIATGMSAEISNARCRRADVLNAAEAATRAAAPDWAADRLRALEVAA